jgi:predicted deacylase
MNFTLQEVSMLKVGSAAAANGSKGQGFIKVGELAIHAEILIPVMIVNGREAGPTLWVNGGVHGDELNGFMAMRRVATGLDPAQLKGALIITPLCNPGATQWRQKLNPYDYLDMDQQFPGDAAGLLSQRLAYQLFREIKEKANCLINFHTAATPFTASPYTVYKAVPGVKAGLNEEVEKLARAFGAYANCKVDISSAKGELPGGLGGALDVNCALQGIPAFMAEVGAGGKFEEENIVAAERGIKNIMKSLRMIPGEIEKPEEQITITKRRFLYCDKGGFLVMDAQPGTVLTGGQRIAHVIDLFSEVETIEAKDKTYIILARVNPIVHTGDRVAFLGLEWSKI